MLHLLIRSLQYNLSAHFSNLPNLLAAAIGMFVNNVIFLMGMWGMLFAGKPENQNLLLYYIALNAIVMTAWGAINFFFGGWMELGELIVSGHFESKLSTPRHPLVLVSTHTLHPSALGDLIMGLFGVGIIFFWGSPEMGFRTTLACGLSAVALFALYVFSGSLAFFIPRGNTVALLIREMTISLSCYPMGKVFSSGMGRIILLLTPASAVSLLPMDWIETSGLYELFLAILSLLVFLALALIVYHQGVKRYQSVSLIGAQS